MNLKNDHRIYTAADIEEYLSGSMPPAKMHEIEKAALDDPFLADAIEGFEGMKEKEWRRQLITLHQHFKESSFSAKIIPLKKKAAYKWWKAAAAVLLVGGSIVTTYILSTKNDQSKENSIAQSGAMEKNNKTKNAPIVTDLLIEDHVKAKSSATALNDQSTVNVSSQSTTHTPGIKSDSNFMYKPPAPSLLQDYAKTTDGYYQKIPDDAQNRNIFLSTEREPANNALTRSNNQLYNGSNDERAREEVFHDKKLFKQQAINQNFNAQVVGPDNSPLPFANIRLKNESLETYADAKGNFRLISPDSLLNVEIKSAGYLARTYTLHSNLPYNKIMLSEDNTIRKEKISGKDVVTSAKRLPSRRATLLKDSVVNVEPVDGWDKYNTYIVNNIDLPKELTQNQLPREMEISFDVTSNGTATNIRVEKSMCKDCDEAAKRLIEQGPQWKAKKGKPAKARIRLRF